MAQFTVSIVKRDAVRTAGLKINTTMEKAAVDCPALWSDRFAPIMETFPCDGTGMSYGVSIMTSATAFDYWAVMPLGKDAKVPAGLTELAVPAGLYAECPVKSLAEMSAGFTYLYTAWGTDQSEYAVDMNGAGLELYTREFMENGSLTLCVPVIKK